MVLAINNNPVDGFQKSQQWLYLRVCANSMEAIMMVSSVLKIIGWQMLTTGIAF